MLSVVYAAVVCPSVCVCVCVCHTPPAFIAPIRSSDMVINSAKTKEMIVGRIDVSNLPPLCTKTGQIE